MNVYEKYGTKEHWKDIPGYEGRYQISSFGKVRSFYRNKKNGNILTPMKNNSGYLFVRLSKNAKKTAFYIHRLVMLVFVGSPPSDDSQVMHLENNKENNKLTNLRYGSASCNSAFQIDDNTVARPNAILDFEKAAKIRKFHKWGMPRKNIAKKLGVAKCTVSNVLTNRTWVNG